MVGATTEEPWCLHGYRGVMAAGHGGILGASGRTESAARRHAYLRSGQKGAATQPRSGSQANGCGTLACEPQKEASGENG